MFQYPRGQNASRMCRLAIFDLPPEVLVDFPGFFLAFPATRYAIFCVHLENSDIFGSPTRTAVINGTVDTGHGSVNLFLSNLEYTVV